MNLGRSMRMGHPGLVGLPLFLTVAFCFALVMAHPKNQATDAHSAPTEKVSSEPNANLKATPKAKKNLSPSDRAGPSSTAKVAAPAPAIINVTAGDGGTPTVTGTPQPNGPALQPAKQNPDDRALKQFIQRTKDTINDVTGGL